MSDRFRVVVPLLLLVSLGPTIASADLGLPDDGWPASIKYTAAPCGASEAHTLFLRKPFGCNPTLAGPGLEDQSWYASCVGGSTTWTIDWFAGLTCSVYDRTEFAPTPSACDQNLKGEFEREFCVGSTLPDAVDPFGTGAALYGAIGSLHSDASCSDPSFFMYIFRAIDVCITEGTGSYVWGEQDGSLVIDDYPTTDCTGSPVEVGPIIPGSCEPFGPNAWASLISVPEPSGTATWVSTLFGTALLSRRRTRRGDGRL